MMLGTETGTWLCYWMLVPGTVWYCWLGKSHREHERAEHVIWSAVVPHVAIVAIPSNQKSPSTQQGPKVWLVRVYEGRISVASQTMMLAFSLHIFINLGEK